MAESERALPELSERQEVVLRAVVAAYLGEAAPIGSKAVASLLPMSLSAASIRNTMAELAELGLIEKPHPSAGRVPTEFGLRVFVDRLLPARALGEYERRDLASAVGEADAETLPLVASQLLSERTRQLGFVLAPRIERLTLRRVTLVRLSRRQVLAVLVAESGRVERRVIEDEESGSQDELDRIAAALNERIVGHTLESLRRELQGELRALRSEANRLARGRLLWLARLAEAMQRPPAQGDVVVATRVAPLDQPEFHDPERVRELLAALEARETLLRVLDSMLESRGVRVVFGEEIGESELRHLTLVTAPYGSPEAPLGVVGVIGPPRMDYPRVIPLVNYLSQLVTERLCA